MQVVGGRGGSKDLPVERADRDMRTCTLRPPSIDRCWRGGKSTLGVAAQMFILGAAERRNSAARAGASPTASTLPVGMNPSSLARHRSMHVELDR
jgi:hypothetical protein